MIIDYSGIFFSRIIYVLKQDIRINVPYSRQNGWTEWADTLEGNPEVSGGGPGGRGNKG